MSTLKRLTLIINIRRQVKPCRKTSFRNHKNNLVKSVKTNYVCLLFPYELVLFNNATFNIFMFVLYLNYFQTILVFLKAESVLKILFVKPL